MNIRWFGMKTCLKIIMASWPEYIALPASILPTIDVCNARSIDGDCANECIAFIFRLQSHCRHGDYPVGVDAASLMGFCACDVYSFAVALCHVHKHIRVFLLRRRQATVTLDVCHGTTDHQVFPLQHLDEFD